MTRTRSASHRYPKGMAIPDTPLARSAPAIPPSPTGRPSIRHHMPLRRPAVARTVRQTTPCNSDHFDTKKETKDSRKQPAPVAMSELSDLSPKPLRRSEPPCRFRSRSTVPPIQDTPSRPPARPRPATHTTRPYIPTITRSSIPHTHNLGPLDGLL
jgi:hypothetical protein